MNFAETAFACLATILFAAPATAKTVDQYGVVVFTQADVNAGGITPGDTPGFPASILVSGSYRLASPLTLTSLKNGIVISAPAVTLDLGGFKVSGGAVGRNGVVSDQIDTTVSNGIVRSFTENGILATGDYISVHRVSVTNNGSYGLRADTAALVRVTESLFSENGTHGVFCGTGCSVQNSTSSTNGGDGITISSVGGGGVILGNVIIGNGRYGIFANGSGYGNNRIAENRVAPTTHTVIALQPNACTPACPAPAP